MRTGQALPTPGSWGTLERTYYVRGDPTTVKVSLLRLHFLPVYPTRVHLRRIERNVVLQALEGGRRVRVRPGGPALRPLVSLYIPILRPAFPLAKSRALLRAPGAPSGCHRAGCSRRGDGWFRAPAWRGSCTRSVTSPKTTLIRLSTSSSLAADVDSPKPIPARDRVLRAGVPCKSLLLMLLVEDHYSFRRL